MKIPLVSVLNISLIFLILVCWLSTAEAAQPGQVVNPIGWFLESNGRAVRPSEEQRQRATVYIFIATTCPISDSYAPQISRIATYFKSKKISTYAVLVDDGVTVGDAAQYKSEYRLACPVLIDPHHILVQNLDATVTPEAVVLDHNRRVLYRGRIDNKYVDFGVARLAATTSDLFSYLLAVAIGKDVKSEQTKAIGCFISTPTSYN